MQARYQANERAADRLARRWGSQTEIARLPVERLEKVNPILDRRAPSIVSLIMKRSEELASTTSKASSSGFWASLPMGKPERRGRRSPQR